MGEQLRLEGPPLRSVVCPLCESRKIHGSFPLRPCICCKGVGRYVIGRWTDPLDQRAFELGLDPRPHGKP